jgi:CRP/FNR family transcriptional regulator
VTLIRRRDGDVIFRPEDRCEGFVLVRAGAIRVSMVASSGREIVLYRVAPGEICLQTFACLVERRAYTAEGVAEGELELEIMPAADFQRRLIDDGAFRQSVFSAIAHRFADFERLVEDVALSPLDARLARALLRLAGADGAVHATHEALAAESGSGRAAVTRQLSAFADAGWVSVERGRIGLRDTAALARIAADHR